jgi:hypothetical protein
MDDKQLFEAIASLPDQMREIGTTCRRMSEWHHGVAELYATLMARIVCSVARDSHAA